MAKQYRKGEILISLFNLLKENQDGMRPKEAIGRLSEILTLTESEKENFPSGDRRFKRIVRFDTIDAAKAGFLI